VTWYLRRITVRQSRCSASGTKLNVSSWATREPSRERAQFSGARADLQTLEAVLVIDVDVGHDDGQYLLVNVNSRDLVWHRPLLGERRACLVASFRVAGYRRWHRNDAQLFVQSCTLRIKQLLGLARSMATLDLAAPGPLFCPN
jgi:hypothetical protein